MKKEDFFEVLGELDDDVVKEAEAPVKKKWNWKVWGAAAACLCLAISAAATRLYLPISGGGGAWDPGGSWPEGVDPVIASIAVYPAGEDVRDVENATLEKIDEETALALEGLGEHLPTWLPDGISFNFADLYETTMKDGTTYHMLRAYYTNGEVIASGIVDGDTGETIPDRLNDEFYVFVMDYKPKLTKKRVHQIADLPKFLSGAWEGGTFHFQCGDVYIGFTPNDSELSVDDILSVIASIE